MLWSLGGLVCVLAAEPEVSTVLGRLPVSQLGQVLVHEHILVDFGGAEVVGPDRYDANEVFEVMRPYLAAVKAAGIQTVVECTPQHLGRDPALLRRLSEATGVTLLTNTGLYQGKYLPDWARTATVEQLAADWIDEALGGVDGTEIKPAFIKIAVDGPPISELQQRIVRAAARTSLATGLPIWMHCPQGRSAGQALDLLADEGCPASRLVVAHADAEPDRTWHWRVAERGAWLSYDGIREPRVDERVDLVTDALRRYPHQVLLSQDAGWYHVGEPRGGNVVELDWLPRVFLPKLREAGVSPELLRQVMVDNPARALTGAQR